MRTEDAPQTSHTGSRDPLKQQGGSQLLWIFPSRCHQALTYMLSLDHWGFLTITLGSLPYNIRHLEVTVVVTVVLYK